MEVTIIKFGLFKSRYYFRSGIPVAMTLLSAVMLSKDFQFDQYLRGVYPTHGAPVRL